MKPVTTIPEQRSGSSRATNQLLAGLTLEERRRLQPYLERVHIHAGTILVRAGDPIGHAYFPIVGLVSLVGTTAEGHMLQVAAVDRRGFVGFPLVLGARATAHDLVVHVPAVAERMRAAQFIAQCQHSTHLRQATLEWIHRHVADIGQSALCHRFHTVQQRLCGWLLRSARSVDAVTIHVTQECLSHMLGSPRSTVSLAALQLQDHGLIRLRHGRVHLVNRGGLEACACECHVLDARGEIWPRT